MIRFFLTVLLGLGLFAAPAGAGDKPRLSVFAAASLRGALDDIAAAHDGEAALSYGGSGQIARQVAQGAPADVVILANMVWMDWLEDQGAITAASRFDLLGNHLVLVGPKGAEALPDVSAPVLVQRLGDRRFAIGQTKGVPAGIYGRQWLENTGLWPQIAPYLAETENVRAALALVARGEAPLGVVYATDAQAESGVVILHRIAGDTHDPIIYPVAMTPGDNPQALEFMQFLKSDTAVEIFRQHGFLPLAGQP